MKHTSKHNAGFTLIELVVAMAVAVIVTAAATSILLFGLRINRQTGDTASQLITVRSLLNVMEDAAAAGKIKEVVSLPAEGEESETYGSWSLKDQEGKDIFRYDVQQQTIYTNEIPVLQDVIASNAIMEGQLLSLSIETKDGTYTSSVYCRTAESVGDPGTDGLPGDITGSSSRDAFIAVLKSQYRSRGEIRQDGKDTGTYYSEWYIQADYDAPGYDGAWNAKTPWCACYISWAMSQEGVKEYLEAPPEGQPNWYANVDDFMRYFTKTPNGKTERWLPGGNEPTPGDLIFFDWDKGNDPEHVGVVLSVRTNGGVKLVYTIEGNSAGRVTIRTYSMTDERIIGYGILRWK